MENKPPQPASPKRAHQTITIDERTGEFQRDINVPPAPARICVSRAPHVKRALRLIPDQHQLRMVKQILKPFIGL